MAILNDNTILQYLDSLLKYNSFTKASEDLYISQPYLTQVVKKTEKHIGVKIIDRGNNQIRLTEAGRLYYKYLTENVEHTNNFINQLNEFTQKKNSVIKIGVLPTLGSFLLPQFLPEFIKNHPDVKIEFEEASPEISVEKAIKGQINFYIGQTPATVGPQLECEVRGHEPYYFMIPKTSKYYHPDQKFVNIESVDIEKLLQEPLLLTCAGSAIRQQINFLTHKFKTNPIIVLESTNIETIASLSAKGIGSTIIPATVAMHLDEGEYNLCPLPQDILSLDYFLAYAKERNLSPNEKDMIETFKKINIIECTQKEGWPKFSELR